MEGRVGNGSRGDIAVDDLTVMDGVCDEIIKQGKLSKPQIDNSFSLVLEDRITLKSDRLLAVLFAFQHSH